VLSLETVTCACLKAFCKCLRERNTAYITKRLMYNRYSAGVQVPDTVKVSVRPPQPCRNASVKRYTILPRGRMGTEEIIHVESNHLAVVGWIHSSYRTTWLKPL